MVWTEKRCLTDLLGDAKVKGFEQIERHYVGDEYRENLHYLVSHGVPKVEAQDRALVVAEQYVKEEIDKRDRRGYIHCEDHIVRGAE